MNFCCRVIEESQLEDDKKKKYPDFKYIFQEVDSILEESLNLRRQLDES